MKPVFHICGDSRNYGDQAIVAGMRRLFNRQFLLEDERPLYLSLDFKQPYEIDSHLVEYINANCSALLIGGGGMFMAGDGFKTVSGWQLNATVKTLAKVKVPIIIFGIGYNHFPYDRAPMPKEATRHIRKLRHHAIRFSARDEGSAREFAAMGIKYIKVIPDPAIYAPAAPGLLPRGRRYIGFSWAGDRPALRFKAKEALLFHNRVRKALREFCKDTGHALVYLPHVGRYDLEAPKIFGAHDGKDIFDLNRVAPWMFPERIDNVPALLGTYEQCAITLGMRGHANIFSFARNVPFVALGDHAKNTYFAEGVGAPVVWNDCTLLLDVLKSTLTNKTLRNRQHKLMNEARSTLEAFAKECVGVILREVA